MRYIEAILLFFFCFYSEISLGALEELSHLRKLMVHSRDYERVQVEGRLLRSQAKASEPKKKPVNFIHIGQSHSVDSLFESSYEKTLKLEVVKSQIGVYQTILKIIEADPKTLIFHEQFNFRSGESEIKFNESMGTGNEDLFGLSKSFEDTFVENFSDILEVKSLDDYIGIKNLENSSFKSKWMFWLSEMLEIEDRMAHECGGLYFFQNDRHKELRSKFRATNPEDTFLALAGRILKNFEKKILAPLANEKTSVLFLEVLKEFQEELWPEDLKNLSLEISEKLSSKIERQAYLYLLAEFGESFFKVVRAEFVSKRREMEALRQIEKYVEEENPRNVILVYGFNHDFESHLSSEENSFSFDIQYEYRKTGDVESLMHKNALGFALDERSSEGSFHARRLEHIEPGFLAKLRKQQKAYEDSIEELD